MTPITKPRPHSPAESLGEWDDQVSKTTEQPAAATSSQPAAPREWTIAQIQAALSRPLPENMLESRKQGGQTIKYIPWHTVNRILDKYSPGFFWEIKTLTVASDRIFLVGRLTINARDGEFYREATGTEALREEYYDKEAGERRLREIAYGDASSKAESQCFRRCAAKFGLGLYMYSRKK